MALTATLISMTTVGEEAGFFVVALGLAAEGEVAATPGGATTNNLPRITDLETSSGRFRSSSPMLASSGGRGLMEKNIAIIVHERALNGVKELSKILFEIRGKCSEEEFNVIRRGVGLAIGRIQMDILEVVNNQFPELDALNE